MSQGSEKMKWYLDLARLDCDIKMLKIGQCFEGIHNSSVSPFIVFETGYPPVNSLWIKVTKHSVEKEFVRDAPDGSYSRQ